MDIRGILPIKPAKTETAMSTALPGGSPSWHCLTLEGVDPGAISSFCCTSKVSGMLLVSLFSPARDLLGGAVGARPWARATSQQRCQLSCTGNPRVQLWPCVKSLTLTLTLDLLSFGTSFQGTLARKEMGELHSTEKMLLRVLQTSKPRQIILHPDSTSHVPRKGGRPRATSSASLVLTAAQTARAKDEATSPTDCCALSSRPSYLPSHRTDQRIKQNMIRNYEP